MTAKQNRRNFKNDLAHATERAVAQERQHFPEIVKAMNRLNAWPDHNGHMDLSKPSEARMRWALAFASRDLEALSEGDFQNLRYEVACFLAFDAEHPIPDGSEYHFLETHLRAKEHIEKAQQWLRDSLRIIVDSPTSESIPIEAIGLSLSNVLLTLSWERRHGRWSSGIILSKSDDGEPYLLHRFLELLKAHANDIRRCPCEDCRKLFLRNRANATCCSKTCTSRHAKRKELGILPERFGKRGRPPASTITTERKTDGQKKTKKSTATRAHSRRVSTKRP